jgi:hypothetical protein
VPWLFSRFAMPMWVSVDKFNSNLQGLRIFSILGFCLSLVNNNIMLKKLASGNQNKFLHCTTTCKIARFKLCQRTEFAAYEDYSVTIHKALKTFQVENNIWSVSSKSKVKFHSKKTVSSQAWEMISSVLLPTFPFLPVCWQLN